MSDHPITFDQWTKCEEALLALTGGVGILLNIRDATLHGEIFDRKSTAHGLYFLAQSIEREIDNLKGALGFNRRQRENAAQEEIANV